METTVEFEPFMKNGLKLLRRTKDASSIQTMFKHFEDAIQEQYGETLRSANAAKKLDQPTVHLLEELGIEQTDDMIADDESSSSNSLSNLLPTMSNSNVEICSSSSPTSSLKQVDYDTVIVIDSDSDSDRGTDNIEYSTCCVCKDSANVGNTLVECLECHLMYHQNCHIPSITDINLNDPRIVWYCFNCRPKDSQKTYSQTSKKESKKSSFKSTPKAKPEISFGSKTSQSVKASSNKSKSSFTIKTSKSTQKPHTNRQPMTSVMEKNIKVMKKKAKKCKNK